MTCFSCGTTLSGIAHGLHNEASKNEVFLSLWDDPFGDCPHTFTKGLHGKHVDLLGGITTPNVWISYTYCASGWGNVWLTQTYCSFFVGVIRRIHENPKL
jgi:hypothetical protein